MKKLIALIPFLAACASPQPEAADSAKTEIEESVKTVSPSSLIGKTIEYRYGEDIYHVTLDTDSTLHWAGIEGGEKGVKAEETYFMEALDSSRIFINWDEENGIAVAQVLDFAQGKVYNHLMINRKLRNGYGEIRVLE